MNWSEYMNTFDVVITGENRDAPYDKDAYVNYVKMNKRRNDRWLKTQPISESTIKAIKSIDKAQKWILISEPWCGDAAHSTPIIQLMSELNENIDLEIVLRDSSELIESYLTNGGKSIPILISRDENGEDLFVWGPRPREIQSFVEQFKENPVPFEEKNAVVQSWYNEDKGQKTQEEIVSLVNNLL